MNTHIVETYSKMEKICKVSLIELEKFFNRRPAVTLDLSDSSLDVDFKYFIIGSADKISIPSIK